MPFGPILICPLELNLIFTANTASEVFAAFTIFVSLSEMRRFVSYVTAQFEPLLEHSAGSTDRRCPPPAPGFITHSVYLISPSGMQSEGFSKLLPSSWGERTLGTNMLDWWWEREREEAFKYCVLPVKGEKHQEVIISRKNLHRLDSLTSEWAVKCFLALPCIRI